MPAPDANKITLTASGTVIGYQGYAGPNVLSTVGIGGKGQDPIDNLYYTYLTNANQTKYQLLGLVENSENAPIALNDIPGIDTAYAASYDARYPVTRWNQLGVLLGTLTGSTLNQPVQELYNAGSFTGVDMVNTNSIYTALFRNGNIVTGTGSALITAITVNSSDAKTLSKYDPSLVGYWDMETTAYSGSQVVLKDLSNFQHNGTCFAGFLQVSCGSGWWPTIVDASGKVGKAMNFDGVNDWVAIGSGSSLNFGAGDFSLSVWMWPRQEMNTWSWLVATSSKNFVFSTSGGWLRASVGPWFTDMVWNQTVIPTSDWSYLVFERKNGTVYTYLNSAPYGTPVSSAYDFSAASHMPLLVGTLYQGTATYEWLNGSLANLRLYNRALSVFEIQALYNATK